MEQNGTYQYLGPKPGSLYRQYFVKGKGVRALSLYHDTQEPDAMTPAEVAANWDVPVEAVYEAIDYCQKHTDVIREDWEEEEKIIKERGWDKPPLEIFRSQQPS
jgi:hypothetical protein